MEKQTIIGENLRAFREKMGLSQQEVADFLGIQRANISYYETEARNIPLKHLESLADLFGVELADLLEENPSQKNVNIAFAFRTGTLNSRDLEAIAGFRKIVKNYIKLTNIERKHAVKAGY
ncbi:MAG: helix-turn-helix transcriptional regulator [Ignavibacteria bacterium]|jgi:transcriptional regulator with XRE-family HTH domain|nr:helix-turn-helix transcriptional regulator [Ignavibacteria bacterium]MCU7519631.1 helix-turn-helix transcriptional regulator [Ignavibacteria bacterium]